MATARKKATLYADTPIESWNVKHFHDYMIARTAEKFGVTYMPYGQGVLSSKWRIEQGQIKNSQKLYGNEVLKAFIDMSINNYVPKADFPYIAFGFMFAFKRDDIPKVQAMLNASEARADEAVRQSEMEVDEDWF